MVMQKSMMKYITRMGQNTGTLKASKNVQIMAMTIPFVAECLAGRENALKTMKPTQLSVSANKMSVFFCVVDTVGQS